MAREDHILVATLSTEPQGITRVLDWLLTQQYPINEVVLVYTTAPVIQPALATVTAEFTAGVYAGIRYRSVAVGGEKGPVADIR